MGSYIHVCTQEHMHLFENIQLPQIVFLPRRLNCFWTRVARAGGPRARRSSLKSPPLGSSTTAVIPSSRTRCISARAQRRPGLPVSAAISSRAGVQGRLSVARLPAESAATAGRSGNAIRRDSTVSMPSPTSRSPPGAGSLRRTPMPCTAPRD